MIADGTRISVMIPQALFHALCRNSPPLLLHQLCKALSAEMADMLFICRYEAVNAGITQEIISLGNDSSAGSMRKFSLGFVSYTTAFPVLLAST